MYFLNLIFVFLFFFAFTERKEQFFLILFALRRKNRILALIITFTHDNNLEFLPFIFKTSGTIKFF